MLLSDLHDATLQSLSFNWANASATLTFELCAVESEFVIVEASGVTNLQCPRVQPWGPSNSVNSAALETQAVGQLLTIEMQSGDVIEIRCQKARTELVPE